jgi:two-component system, cell cycle response regulator
MPTVMVVPSASLRKPLIVVAWISAAFVIAHALHGVGAFHGADHFFDTDVYLGLLVLGALVCAVRAIAVRRDRVAWIFMAASLGCWAAGDVAIELVWAGDPPFPSFADALYLAYYPLAYVAMLLLTRSRFRKLDAGVWLDGIVVALTFAAVAAALVFKPILDATSGDSATVATTLAYPVGDLVLLMVVALIVTATGFRPGLPLTMIGIGLLVTAVADTDYAYVASTGTYQAGGLLDTAWPAGLLLTGFAGWVRGPRPTSGRAETLPVFLASAVCALLAIAMLIVDHYDRLTPLALWLASSAVLVATLRAGLSYVDKVRALRRAEGEALTDGLTGLGNRRLLMLHLDEALAPQRPAPRTLVFFDLDGFKQYNDVFGHSAGDALLARLGQRLAAAVEGEGRAYRLGGDEFCVLFDRDVAGDEKLLATTADALSETGEAFSVSSSSGLVTMPREATTPEQTLHLADVRMYEQKGAGRLSAALQARDVLLQTLHEQEPALHEHMAVVAERAVALARRLGLSAEAVDEVGRAAQLHDVGKIAIPAEILHKPGPLNEEEWQFMRQHTIVGERILSAAPALGPVARLVRASHERHDGSGYPDGLASDQIPMGARIVALCDAYDAMVSDRPYRRGMSHERACAEIREGAGTQFDPAIVDAFLELFGPAPQRSRFAPSTGIAATARPA